MKIADDDFKRLSERMREGMKTKYNGDEVFTLDTDQTKKLVEWMKTRPPKYEGAIGGRYTYSFTPTGLGTIVKVEDTLLKETIDLTDYESW